MEWTDEALVLGADKHGESSVIVELLTRSHGRHKGLVRGGSGGRMRGVMQAGNRVAVTWRGRLTEHLGTATLELIDANAVRMVLREPGASPARYTAAGCSVRFIGASVGSKRTMSVIVNSEVSGCERRHSRYQSSVGRQRAGASDLARQRLPEVPPGMRS